MYVIGVTGGIGCGKSHVCKYVSESYDAELLICDDIANEICEPGGRVYETLKAELPAECYNEDGTRNRKVLGDLAFKNPELLLLLNRIIHPAVKDEVKERIKAAKEKGKRLAVIEAALLIEAGYRDVCDEYWYVYTKKEFRIERLLASRPLSVEKIEDIISKQLSEEEFTKACDYVVDNNSDRDALEKRLDEKMKLLLAAIS